jgi:pimeloyl-ACP methyl ester carboxylesterase
LLALTAVSATPQTTAGLVLVSTTSKMISEKDYPGVDRRFCRAMQIKLGREREAVLRDFFRRCLAPRKDPAVEDLFFNRARQMDERALAAGLRHLAETDARGVLKTLRVPTRVLHGERDEIIPAASARFMAERIPGALYEEIPGEGHALAHAVPGRIAAAVRSLLHGNR